MIFLLLLFLGGETHERQESWCDWIEVNHVMDDQGEIRLSQVVYWRFTGTSEPMVVGWRMFNKSVFRECKNGYVYDSFTANSGAIRTMRGKVIILSVTEYDIEAENRNRFPVGERPVLFGVDGTSNLAN